MQIQAPAERSENSTRDAIIYGHQAKAAEAGARPHSSLHLFIL